MFAHGLAERLGMTVGDMLDGMTLVEFRRWQAYERVRPVTREEMHLCRMTWFTLLAWGCKVTLDMLLPKRGTRAAAPRRATAAEVYAAMAPFRSAA